MEHWVDVELRRQLETVGGVELLQDLVRSNPTWLELLGRMSLQLQVLGGQ